MRCILLFDDESSSLAITAAGKAVAAYSAYLAAHKPNLHFTPVAGYPLLATAVLTVFFVDGLPPAGGQKRQLLSPCLCGPAATARHSTQYDQLKKEKVYWVLLTASHFLRSFSLAGCRWHPHRAAAQIQR